MLEQLSPEQTADQRMNRLRQLFRKSTTLAEGSRAGAYRDLSAWSASLGLHLLLLICLATASIVLPGKIDELTLSYEPPATLGSWEK